jgi:hypothetical protein
MSLELIYTSAPRGLGPSSSGFCTVAATGGMSRQIMMRLEALSGYQFHFSLSDPQANQNPVNYAHTRVSVGGQTHSVLSRIGFAGADYSGRTNKLAHHIMLERGESLPQGPAWMFMTQGVFFSSWNREPANLPRRSPWTAVAGQPRPQEPATTWEAMTGDAGWGGLLAKAFRENPKTPAFVVFEPGQQLLPLFEESLALLSPEERWQVGFATYYTALATGTECHWRGILKGSPASKELARFPNATVIDLTAPLGEAPTNACTEAARTGQTLPPVRGPERAAVRVVDRSQQPVAAANGSPGAAPLAMAASYSPGDDLLSGLDGGEALQRPPAPPQRRRSPLLVPLLAAACGLLLVTNVLTYMWWDQDVAALQARSPAAGSGGREAAEPSSPPDSAAAVAPSPQPAAGTAGAEKSQPPAQPPVQATPPERVPEKEVAKVGDGGAQARVTSEAGTSPAQAPSIGGKKPDEAESTAPPKAPEVAGRFAAPEDCPEGTYVWERLPEPSSKSGETIRYKIGPGRTLAFFTMPPEMHNDLVPVLDGKTLRFKPLASFAGDAEMTFRIDDNLDLVAECHRDSKVREWPDLKKAIVVGVANTADAKVYCIAPWRGNTNGGQLTFDPSRSRDMPESRGSTGGAKAPAASNLPDADLEFDWPWPHTLRVVVGDNVVGDAVDLDVKQPLPVGGQDAAPVELRVVCRVEGKKVRLWFSLDAISRIRSEAAKAAEEWKAANDQMRGKGGDGRKEYFDKRQAAEKPVKELLDKAESAITTITSVRIVDYLGCTVKSMSPAFRKCDAARVIAPGEKSEPEHKPKQKEGN